MKEFGIQIHSVWDKMDMRLLLKALNAMGYNRLQIAGKMPISYEEYGELAAEAGIKIVGTYAAFCHWSHAIYFFFLILYFFITRF